MISFYGLVRACLEDYDHQLTAHGGDPIETVEEISDAIVLMANVVESIRENGRVCWACVDGVEHPEASQN